MAATFSQTDAYQSPAEQSYDGEEQEQSLGTPWPMIIFLAIPLMELVGQIVSEEESARALFVAPAVGLLGVMSIFDMLTRRRREITFDSGLKRFFLLAGGLIALGIASAVYASLKHNSPTYIAAEVYHWFVEILATAFLGIWAASRYSIAQVCSAYIRACVLYGVIGVGIAVLGVMHLAPGGGVQVAGSRLFRLELGRGYPLIPLIIVGSIAFYPPAGLRPRTKFAIVVGVLLLTLATIATLKRTQWLVVPVCLFLAFFSRRQLMVILGLAVCGLLLLWGAKEVAPARVDAALSYAKETLTYNKNWSIDDTLNTRERQSEDGIKEGLREPFGQGFGAEINTVSPDGKRITRQHYLHNLHAYYILQLGPVGYGVSLVLLGAIAWAVFLNFDVVDDCRWMSRASLFSLIACAMTGLTLVSVHTTFAGVALGLAITSYARCKDQLHYDELEQWDIDQLAAEQTTSADAAESSGASPNEGE